MFELNELCQGNVGKVGPKIDLAGNINCGLGKSIKRK